MERERDRDASTHRKRATNGSARRDRKHNSRASPLRDDERSQRRRHRSHKRRRHRTRSATRSHSGSVSASERKPPVVYMNPAFQQSYGAPAAPSQADIELRQTLVNQLSSCEQRINSLESELRAAQLARGRAEQRVFEVSAEKLRMESQNSEIVQVMKTLERAVEELQKSNHIIKMENDRRRRDYENSEKAISSCKEQNNFLNERNMKLVKKCEELRDENKAIHNRRDESAKELADMRPRVEILQVEVRQRVEDGRKMMAQLRSYEEKERVWRKERLEFEKRIEIKDAMAAAERKNHEEWKKRNTAEKTELERKVKLSEPDVLKALDAEMIKKAVEEIRLFYEQKLETVTGDINGLKKKFSNVKVQYAFTSDATPNRGLKRAASIDYRPNSAPPAQTGQTNGSNEVEKDPIGSNDVEKDLVESTQIEIENDQVLENGKTEENNGEPME